MKGSLLSLEDVARIKAKYPSPKKEVTSPVKEDSSILKLVPNERVQEYGPVPEAVELGRKCPGCRIREINTEFASRCNYCEALRARIGREQSPKRFILYRLKGNAKTRQIPFSLKEKDIPDFPKFCPVFPWIKLEYSVGDGRSDGSVSIDRIDNSKGYVPGNIRVISDLANKLKGRASDKELAALGRDAEIRMTAKGNQ
jgi:hypothetical protein